MKRLERIRTPSPALALVAVVAATGGIAVAAIPAGDGTITACYIAGTGQMRVVDSAVDCKNNETALTWSKQGVAGEKGDTGPAGPEGDPGPVAGYQRVINSHTVLPGFGSMGFVIVCPSGTKVVGGGHTDLPAGWNAASNHPSTSTSWHVGMRGPALATGSDVTVYAICVNA